MTAVLMDTHVWVWSFLTPDRLSDIATRSIADADAALVSPVSFFEITQKVRLGKWSELQPASTELPIILETQGATEAPLVTEICILAGSVDWDHRDPFDRLIAATALHLNVPLVTKDKAFASLTGLSVIW